LAGNPRAQAPSRDAKVRRSTALRPFGRRHRFRPRLRPVTLEPTDSAPASVDSSERVAVRALLARTVRVRFALDVTSFADRVLALVRRSCLDSVRPTLAQVERLSLDDLYLATACADGDDQAWEELARRHLGFIREFARRFLPGPEAENLADQVVADLWERRKLVRYEGRSTLRTWLAAIVAHAALNLLKSSRRSVPLSSDEFRNWERDAALARPSAALDPHAALLRQIVDLAIGGLPREDKLLLQLYYEQGLTLDEMAVVLRVSKATLSRRLERTRQALRTSIDALSRARAGASADVLRAGLDLGQLDLDLAAALGGSRAMEGKQSG
jgi:RNA polymerase sigma-70 factor, ECF subfamily